MARKIKKLPEGTILFYYTKSGKVVSDLDLDDWYKDLIRIIIKASKLKSTIIVKIATENMMHLTRRLVVIGHVDHNKVRYRYGRRVFRIDREGVFVGISGKHYPKNFLGKTKAILKALPCATKNTDTEGVKEYNHKKKMKSVKPIIDDFKIIPGFYNTCTTTNVDFETSAAKQIITVSKKNKKIIGDFTGAPHSVGDFAGVSEDIAWGDEEDDEE